MSSGYGIGMGKIDEISIVDIDLGLSFSLVFVL